MFSALVVLALLIGGGFVLFAWAMRLRICRPRSFFLCFGTYAIVLAAMWAQGALSSRETEASRSIPKPVLNEGFATSNSCRSCHPDQYTSWHASYHSTMTQVASPEVIVAPFDGAQLSGYSETGRVERRGDEFWVEMVDPVWEVGAMSAGGDVRRRAIAPRVERRVLMTTGSHHFQVFWTRGRGSELWQFPWRWNIAEGRWMHRRDVFLTPPEADHGTEFRIWNNLCIDCHSVAGQPRGSMSRDPVTGMNELTFNTRAAELGIACEACHGPAEEHVRINRNPLRRYGLRFFEEGDPTVVNPAREPHDVASEICGQCHSHSEYTEEIKKTWYRTGRAYRAGDEITKFIRFVQPTDDDPNIDGKFWADGNCRSAGRDYTGMSASACFKRGKLSCLSCHQLHRKPDDPRLPKQWASDQMALGMKTNQACLGCHEKFAEQDALEDHTHHLAKSSGSLCYNCHMPHTSYGLLTAMRTHHIDVPVVTPLRSNSRPNACNLCHLDQTLAWSARHLSDWYGTPEVDLDEEEQTVAASLLWALRGDAGQRVITAWHFGWASAQEASGDEWMAPFLARLLDDPYSVIRFVAFRSLRSLPGFADFANAYDAPPAEQAEQVARALEIWKRNRTDASNPGAARLLLDTSNELRTEAVRALLERRDNRPVGSIE